MIRSLKNLNLKKIIKQRKMIRKSLLIKKKHEIFIYTPLNEILLNCCCFCISNLIANTKKTGYQIVDVIKNILLKINQNNDPIYMYVLI